MKFYVCKNCGNTIALKEDDDRKKQCCGEEMQLELPNTKDGAIEKHVPVVKKDKNQINVQVGEVIHPMDENHYISKIILETNLNVYAIKLTPNQKPIINYLVKPEEKLIGAYSYCNLHGLYKSKD